MPHEMTSLQNEIDNASERVGALCDLLAAANDAPVSAASVYVLLKPVARQLSSAAGDFSDQLRKPLPRTK